MTCPWWLPSQLEETNTRGLRKGAEDEGPLGTQPAEGAAPGTRIFSGLDRCPGSTLTPEIRVGTGSGDVEPGISPSVPTSSAHCRHVTPRVFNPRVTWIGGERTWLPRARSAGVGMVLPWPMRVLWVWPEGVAKQAPPHCAGGPQRWGFSGHQSRGARAARPGRPGLGGWWPGTCPGDGARRVPDSWPPGLSDFTHETQIQR